MSFSERRARPRRGGVVAGLAVLLALLAPAGGLHAEGVGNPLQPSPIWDDLRSSIIGTDEDPPIDPAILDLEAPKRADNPALVPVRITQPAGAPQVRSLVVVIDGNPAPVAAEFTFGPALMPLDFELRVRVDTYSDLRAIATLEDGRKVMAGRFVKASGGCAAPAGKSVDEVRAGMGQMRFRSAPPAAPPAPGAPAAPADPTAPGGTVSPAAAPAPAPAPAAPGREIATLMIRHPNFSGLQRDQVTLLTIPAEFIQTLELRQGGALLWRLDAGISISEDPVFRFAWTPGQGPVTVHAEDTEGRVWDQSF